MIDPLKIVDVAMTMLVSIQQDTKSSEIADALDILSAWREQYVQDNSQFGVGS